MTAERRAICRDVVSDELAEDGLAGGDAAQRVRRVGEIATVAHAARATEGVEKRFVGIERREGRKHARISGGPEGGIDRRPTAGR